MWWSLHADIHIRMTEFWFIAAGAFWNTTGPLELHFCLLRGFEKSLRERVPCFGGISVVLKNVRMFEKITIDYFAGVLGDEAIFQVCNVPVCSCMCRFVRVFFLSVRKDMANIHERNLHLLWPLTLTSPHHQGVISACPLCTSYPLQAHGEGQHMETSAFTTGNSVFFVNNLCQIQKRFHFISFLLYEWVLYVQCVVVFLGLSCVNPYWRQGPKTWPATGFTRLL